MCRVVLLNQTQYVNHQLGAGLPSIPGRGIVAPPDEITRPTSVHVAVVQQLLQLDSAGHRESPLMEVEEEERRSPHDHGDPCVPESFFDRVTQELRNDLEHERDRRLQMADTVSEHRAEFAFAQLENERALTSLRRRAKGSSWDC
uniref:Uncharacterized protein n=1 Tax=Peronospora matthiolae TaxID=2874970 RepID=A0AAV1VI84_9STRA